MPIEIERKFLVTGAQWKAGAVRQVHIRDGLLGVSGNRKVRIRIAGDVATVAIKSKVSKARNMEFEYRIPLDDAEYLLAHECDGNLLSKVRHFVPFAGRTWEVDVYEPPLQGIILAEVELQSEYADLAMPNWVGVEVTGRPEWKKINMLRAAEEGRVPGQIASPPGAGR